MADYLKHTPMYSRQVTDAVRATVSEMLERIEREGEAAIRHYSRELDGWDPPSFVVDADDVRAASGSLTPELRDHIAFAQEQVRTFAAAQRASLTDIEIETRPGVVLGHRHIPVAAVGSYVPGGRYPMLASAFMTVVVPKVAGVRTGRRGRPAARGRGRPSRDAACDGDQRRRPDRLPRRRPGAGRAGVRDRGARARRDDRRRRQRVRRRGQAPAVRPRRDRPAGRADRDPGDRRRARRPRARRRRPARPGRARADLARDPDHDQPGVRRGGDRTGRPAARDLADGGGRRRGVA